MVNPPVVNQATSRTPPFHRLSSLNVGWDGLRVPKCLPPRNSRGLFKELLTSICTQGLHKSLISSRRVVSSLHSPNVEETLSKECAISSQPLVWYSCSFDKEMQIDSRHGMFFEQEIEQCAVNPGFLLYNYEVIQGKKTTQLFSEYLNYMPLLGPLWNNQYFMECRRALNVAQMVCHTKHATQDPLEMIPTKVV